MRGRHSAAILRRMGLDQLIAADEAAYHYQGQYQSSSEEAFPTGRLSKSAGHANTLRLARLGAMRQKRSPELDR